VSGSAIRVEQILAFGKHDDFARVPRSEFGLPRGEEFK
jgi:hypothetical protein